MITYLKHGRSVHKIIMKSYIRGSMIMMIIMIIIIIIIIIDIIDIITVF